MTGGGQLDHRRVRPSCHALFAPNLANRQRCSKEGCAVDDGFGPRLRSGHDALIKPWCAAGLTSIRARAMGEGVFNISLKDLRR